VTVTACVRDAYSVKILRRTGARGCDRLETRGGKQPERGTRRRSSFLRLAKTGRRLAARLVPSERGGKRLPGGIHAGGDQERANDQAKRHRGRDRSGRLYRRRDCQEIRCRGLYDLCRTPQRRQARSLGDEIQAGGGEIFARSLDARKEDEITAFLNDADRQAPLEVCIFNVGANVNFPILDTTERVFRKVWEMACYSGFLAGREAARLMLPRGRGNIFFTGATASLRGGRGYAAFASAKFGLRAVAQAMARELGPQNIHVAHLIIDSGVDTEWVRQRRIEALGPDALNDPDALMPPASVADAYWRLYDQPRSAWTFEMEIRPYKETW
jgi:NAD(P)-dependent dehydrogenase (short-subunit alcohol dehydrogenase family)